MYAEPYPASNAHIGIRLLEPAVLGARDRQVAHDVQRVPAAGRPPRDHRDDDLRHETDEPLHLEDVEAPGAGRVGSGRVVGGVRVAVATADALVAARAERPAAVLRARTVARQQHDPDARVLAGDVEGAVELVDGVRAEGVAHLGTVERDARDATVARDVRRDVGVRVRTCSEHPLRGIEQLGDEGVGHPPSLRAGAVIRPGRTSAPPTLER
jgi:hypothetical protein